MSPSSGVECPEVVVRGAEYADCEGLYTVTDSSVAWARDRPVYRHRTRDRSASSSLGQLGQGRVLWWKVV